MIMAAMAYISPAEASVAAFMRPHQRAAIRMVHLAVHIHEEVGDGAARDHDEGELQERGHFGALALGDPSVGVFVDLGLRSVLGPLLSVSSIYSWLLVVVVNIRYLISSLSFPSSRP